MKKPCYFKREKSKGSLILYNYTFVLLKYWIYNKDFKDIQYIGEGSFNTAVLKFPSPMYSISLKLLLYIQYLSNMYILTILRLSILNFMTAIFTTN